MRVVFAGTPEFSVPALDALLAAGHEIIAVYTQPDRPAGRGRQLRGSPVKCRAQEMNIPISQPASLKNKTEADALKRLDADVMIVAAYGLILPPEILRIPRFGCINIHASLLPRWRGAAPIQRAIMAGDAQTGISIMQMDDGLDTGPVLMTTSTAISDDETAGGLHDRLAMIGAEAVVETLAVMQDEQNGRRATPQDNSQACYAGKLTKSEAMIDWSQSADEIVRMVRAMNPWPVAETRWNGMQLRVWDARALASPCGPGSQPGQVNQVDSNGIQVCCGAGVVVLRVVQIAGGKQLPVNEFINAHDLSGAILGESQDTSAT